MSQTFTNSNNAASPLASDIIQAAFEEIGVLAEGEKVSASYLALGMSRLQRWIDQVNARRELIYSISFLVFTTTGNLAPHTIGPGGNFNMPLRPVDIQSASFLLNSNQYGTGSQTVDLPINIRDAQWWGALPVKNLLTQVITDLYYDPASPLGNLNFWPICTLANPVRLEVWNSIAQPISPSTTLYLPQGYWDATIWSVARKLCPVLNRQFSPDMKSQWNDAMRIIEQNNDKPPILNLDIGSPNSRKGGRPDFNFLTGLRR